MSELSEFAVSTYLDRLAERTPSPGGGSVAAVVGALSAALGRMVVAYSTPKNQAPTSEIAEASHHLARTDAILRELIDADAAAYESMTAARKIARSDPMRAADYQSTVITAIGVPMQIAAASAKTLMVLEKLAGKANPHLLSDLGVSSILAAAATRASRYMVNINLAELTDAAKRDHFRADIDRIVEQSQSRADKIEEFLRKRS